MRQNAQILENSQIIKEKITITMSVIIKKKSSNFVFNFKFIWRNFNLYFWCNFSVSVYNIKISYSWRQFIIKETWQLKLNIIMLDQMEEIYWSIKRGHTCRCWPSWNENWFFSSPQWKWILVYKSIIYNGMHNF